MGLLNQIRIRVFDIWINICSHCLEKNWGEIPISSQIITIMYIKHIITTYKAHIIPNSVLVCSCLPSCWNWSWGYQIVANFPAVIICDICDWLVLSLLLLKPCLFFILPCVNWYQLILGNSIFANWAYLKLSI